jgi:hypothetical protein
VFLLLLLLLLEELSLDEVDALSLDFELFFFPNDPSFSFLSPSKARKSGTELGKIWIAGPVLFTPRLLASDVARVRESDAAGVGVGVGMISIPRLGAAVMRSSGT